MRLTVCFLLILFSACKAKLSERQQALKDIEGNWLIVFPDHNGLTAKPQKEAYGKAQDSIVSLMGLKLISFEKDGLFRQIDSVYSKGRWELTDDMKIRIHQGGEGFAPFEAGLVSYKDSVLKIEEVIRYKNYKFPIVWNLKRMGKGEVAALFAASANNWRQIPKQPETEAQLVQRVKAMLNYYSSYYHMVAREASYFIPLRTPLPFRFYQHAIGLQSLDSRKDFQQLFYDSTQAARAHYLVEAAINRSRFPGTSQNYVHEYAAYMEILAKEIEQIGK